MELGEAMVLEAFEYCAINSPPSALGSRENGVAYYSNTNTLLQYSKLFIPDFSVSTNNESERNSTKKEVWPANASGPKVPSLVSIISPFAVGIVTRLSTSKKQASVPNSKSTNGSQSWEKSK